MSKLCSIVTEQYECVCENAIKSIFLPFGISAHSVSATVCAYIKVYIMCTFIYYVMYGNVGSYTHYSFVCVRVCVCAEYIIKQV